MRGELRLLYITVYLVKVHKASFGSVEDPGTISEVLTFSYSEILRVL